MAAAQLLYCQYVYLLEQRNPLGSRERRPHDPGKAFAPGEFEHIFFLS
ncbi:MAG: hypothetical protein HC838_03030 [Spirulinaceae cyanobacterium RM2_2_10]|nr:hypothetical protein [Spirulinaceae cyanobacterium SM2_1_0]NJO19235.1 hypothetical protein [Spirulinaceae cyanobacterium RM2_2_10]